MKRAGCAEVWMGVESGSQQVLDAMDKGLRVRRSIAARARLRDAGIRACYFPAVWLSRRELERHPADDSAGAQHPPGRHRRFLLLSAPRHAFYRVQEQIGHKRNWTDSDDLCLMFKAAYKDEFYHALRNALHAEVDSWHGQHLRSTQVTGSGSSVADSNQPAET